MAESEQPARSMCCTAQAADKQSRAMPPLAYPSTSPQRTQDPCQANPAAVPWQPLGVNEGGVLKWGPQWGPHRMPAAAAAAPPPPQKKSKCRCAHLADGRDLGIADLVRPAHVILQVDLLRQVHLGRAGLRDLDRLSLLAGARTECATAYVQSPARHPALRLQRRRGCSPRAGAAAELNLPARMHPAQARQHTASL